MFESIDSDHSGEINYTEFLAALDHHSISKGSLEEAFNYLDSDGCGQISKNDFHKICEHNHVST